MKNLLFILSCLFLLNTACQDPFMNTTYEEKTDEDIFLSNAEFLMKYEDRYSLWIELLKHADLYNALNDAVSTSTIFAPNNDAMEKFLAWREVETVQELDREYARYVVQVHILPGGKLLESDFINYVSTGSIPAKTLFESYLTTSYGFKDLEVDDEFLDQVVLEDSLSIYLNNQAKVANLGRGIETLNGMVYTMDDVIRPLSETIVDVLQTYKEFDIFIEALELTGYDEVVSTYADSILNLDGTTSVTDVRFTCFAAPDEIYKKEGINSVADLATHLNAGTDYAKPDNALYQYVAYHFMPRAYTKEELCAFEQEGQVLIYDMKLPGAVIIVGDGAKPAINKDAGFVRSNIKARNGLIHQIDHILPVYEPDPVRVIWDFCDRPDIISFVNAYGAAQTYGDLYSSPLGGVERAVNLSYLEPTFTDWGTLTSFEYKSSDTRSNPRTYNRVGFVKTKYVSLSQRDVCQYGSLKNNLMVLNLGYLGNITMQTPTIIKGKYKVVFYYAGDPTMSMFYTNGSSVRFDLDAYRKSIYVWKALPGAFVDPAKTTIASFGIASEVIWEEVVFEESGTHTFKATMMDIQAKTHAQYRQRWDYIEFIPID